MGFVEDLKAPKVGSYFMGIFNLPPLHHQYRHLKQHRRVSKTTVKSYGWTAQRNKNDSRVLPLLGVAEIEIDSCHFRGS
ncbi:Triose-phosphate Transporter family [Musa troglodytarum]|uniref:Triose-phosphate Transporter family n=1 Tax=Musa troglodytarum TaxID=320322 RepID=A0A9E7HG51_9LILI|nr:Triose-phosphate Transporter family [Musa troglodytarum]